MIQTLAERSVGGNLADARKFTIKVTGKAFDALINSLYSDKPLAVLRELATNAYDSHVQRGIENRPIEIYLPTALNPSLVIRDYGVSMDHDMVLDRYSTLFDSTKDETNEVTGMFGIGSKSPFAYTTTFGVRAILNGVARTYLVALDATGIPEIGLADESPTDEEQGFEITVNVKHADFHKFKTAAERVLLGFRGRTQPKIFGAEVVLPEIVLSGENWTLYRPKEQYSSDYVQQGCVVYPLDGAYSVGTTKTQIVIEVPIGSINVASSREQLSYDSRSEDFINGVIDRVRVEVQAAAKVLLDKEGSRLERARRAIFLDDLVDVPERDMLIDIEAFGLKVAYPRKRDSRQPWQHVRPDTDHIDVVWGLECKLIRKLARVRAHANAKRDSRYRTRYSQPLVLIAPQTFGARDAARLSRLTGIPMSCIKHVRTLDDPGPPESSGNGPSGVAKRKSVKTLPDGASYVLRSRGRYLDHVDIDGALAARIGFDPSKVVQVTQGELEKMGVDYTRHWRQTVNRLIEANKALFDGWVANRAAYLIRSRAITPYAAVQICDAIGLVEDPTLGTSRFASGNYGIRINDAAEALRDKAFACYPALSNTHKPSDQEVLQYIASTTTTKGSNS